MTGNISKKILHGSLWMLFQTISLKLIAFVTQIILAYILLPNDFGKIAIVTAITNITFVTQQFGVQDVLIKRGEKSFVLWLNDAKKLMLYVIFVAIVVSMLFAVISGIFYTDIELTYLILLLILSLPFQAYSIIPETKLKIELNFSLLSKVKVVEFLSIQFLVILLALLGLGVYSFVLPVILVLAIKCFILFRLTKINLGFKYKASKWKYLLKDSLNGFYFALTSRMSFQMDYLILGFFATKSEVGLYFMAFTLAVQSVGLLVSYLPNVIFPALKKITINDQELGTKLQSITFFLALTGALLVSWQSFNSGYLIRIFLNEKWIKTISLVEILSIGMFFRIVSSQWVVPLKVRGQFKKLSNISVFSLLIMILILIPLSFYCGSLGTAYGIAVYYFLIGFYQLYKSFLPLKVNLVLLFKKSFTFLLFSCLSFYAAKLITENVIIDVSIYGLIIKLLLSSLIGFSLYIVLLKAFAKKFFNEMWSKVRLIIG